MYEYALIAEFDEKTNDYFFKLWEGLMKDGMLSEKSQPKSPHITIADYLEIDLDEFISLMKSLYKDKKKIVLNFKSLGTFINTETLYFQPNLSRELLYFHLEHHNSFSNFEYDGNSYYLPGNWIPHCTVWSRLGRENIIKVFEYCYNNPIKFKSEISKLSLLRFEISNEVKILDIKEVHCEYLKWRFYFNKCLFSPFNQL